MRKKELKPRPYGPVPKKIHYVWVGGPIKMEYLISILNTSSLARKSGFQLFIWVDDEKNIQKTLQSMTPDSLAFPKTNKIAGMQIRNIKELLPLMQKDPFFKEDDRYKQIVININREMNGFKNLAAVADFLRYIILLFEGGYYLDTDIKFLNKDMKQVLQEETLICGFKAYRCIGRWHSRSFPEAEFDNGNNDLMAAVPGHPILKDTLSISLKNYKVLDNQFLPYWYYKRMGWSNKECNKTEMDLKRWPYKEENNKNYGSTAGRLSLTLECAAGPKSLVKALQIFWNNYVIINDQKSTEELHSALKSLTFNYILYPTVAGINVELECHASWLKTPKKREPAFDTHSLLSEKKSFFIDLSITRSVGRDLTGQHFFLDCIREIVKFVSSDTLNSLVRVNKESYRELKPLLDIRKMERNSLCLEQWSKLHLEVKRYYGHDYGIKTFEDLALFFHSTFHPGEETAFVLHLLRVATECNYFECIRNIVQNPNFVNNYARHPISIYRQTRNVTMKGMPQSYLFYPLWGKPWETEKVLSLLQIGALKFQDEDLNQVVSHFYRGALTVLEDHKHHSRQRVNAAGEVLLYFCKKQLLSDKSIESILKVLTTGVTANVARLETIFLIKKLDEILPSGLNIFADHRESRLMRETIYHLQSLLKNRPIVDKYYKEQLEMIKLNLFNQGCRTKSGQLFVLLKYLTDEKIIFPTRCVDRGLGREQVLNPEL